MFPNLHNSISSFFFQFQYYLFFNINISIFSISQQPTSLWCSVHLVALLTWHWLLLVYNKSIKQLYAMLISYSNSLSVLLIFKIIYQKFHKIPKMKTNSCNKQMKFFRASCYEQVSNNLPETKDSETVRLSLLHKNLDRQCSLLRSKQLSKA
jgi:hypothetical protein